MNNKLKEMVTAALLAALYLALGIAFAPIGYGPVQFRVGEALCMLAIYRKSAVWGLTLGCALTNFYGFITMANILGPLDILFGTLATLIAALLSYALREKRIHGLPVAAALPPILVNAVVIGLELTFFMSGQFIFSVFIVQAALVALGQTAAVGVLGLLLVQVLERTGLNELLFQRI